MTSQEILQQTADTNAAVSMLKAMQLGGFTSFLDSQMAQQVRASGPLLQTESEAGTADHAACWPGPCLAAAQEAWEAKGPDGNVIDTLPPCLESTCLLHECSWLFSRLATVPLHGYA